MRKSDSIKTLRAMAIFFLINASVVAAEQTQDLASAARDPTASLTAFAIRYDYIESFYNLPSADQTQLVLQPIIPWKWGNQKHIARLTVPYVTSGPDWGVITEETEFGIPPNYVPTAKQEGLADIAAVGLLIFDTSWGRQGIGAAIILPTASEPALGSEKWSLGPAYVAITKKDNFQGGFLAQWLVSIDGEEDRDDINSLTIQPFGGFGFSGGWSLNTSEMVFNYSIENSKWTSVPPRPTCRETGEDR